MDETFNRRQSVYIQTYTHTHIHKEMYITARQGRRNIGMNRRLCSARQGLVDWHGAGQMPAWQTLTLSSIYRNYIPPPPGSDIGNWPRYGLVYTQDLHTNRSCTRAKSPDVLIFFCCCGLWYRLADSQERTTCPGGPFISRIWVMITADCLCLYRCKAANGLSVHKSPWRCKGQASLKPCHLGDHQSFLLAHALFPAKP